MNFLFNNIKCLEFFSYDFAKKRENQDQNQDDENPIIEQKVFSQIHFSGDLQATGKSDELLSLKDVLLNYQGSSKDEIESYSMGSTPGVSEQHEEKTIILKRNDLMIDGKECQVVNFIDLSVYTKLKQEKENNELLKTLNTSVHHEMLAPL